MTNISNHEQLVINARCEQVKSAQAQINAHGVNIAHVEELETEYGTQIIVTVSTGPEVKPVPQTFGKTLLGTMKALKYINTFVVVCPVTSAQGSAPLKAVNS